MTYNSGNTILGSDVADRFWNDYFAAQIDTAQSYTNAGSNAAGTLGPSGDVPSGKFTVQTWYWQQEVVPRFSDSPNQARGAQPARDLPGTDFTGVAVPSFPTGTIKGGTSTGSIFDVCKIEMGRFANFVNAFRWTSYRTLQTYGPAGQGTVFDQTVKRYAIFNEFTIGSPATGGFTDTGDSITTAEFDGAFNILAQLYATQRAAGAHTQATDYTICHNSCHTSCHRNRGRR
jgi:hypothetical protein